MIRRGLFLALVGAVAAKAQSLVERRYTHGIDVRDFGLEIGPKQPMTYALLTPGVRDGEAATSITTPRDLKPRSGYCGVCGTKGEYFTTVGTLGEPEFSGTTLRIPNRTAHVLRCPHCGTLFTETNNAD